MGLLLSIFTASYFYPYGWSLISNNRPLHHHRLQILQIDSPIHLLRNRPQCLYLAPVIKSLSVYHLSSVDYFRDMTGL